MRRIIMAALAASLLVAGAAPAMASPPSVDLVEVRLVDTHVFGYPVSQVDLAPGDEPGSNWMSGDIWHARRIPVSERMVTTGAVVEIGTLERSVNFNWDMAALASGDVVSQAWCSFTMAFHDPALGSVPGWCGGSLLHGIVVGNGPEAHVRGVYRLEAGGVPGVGPYLLTLAIGDR